jgi:beta-lactamase superfamily II metal-dependent hydrolase
MARDHVYAGPGAAGKVFVRENPDSKSKKLQQLIWGDWVEVISRDREADGWLEVKGRGERGWLHVSDSQAERLLEINFVDVGQGDGAFLVTPDDEFALVDAGAGSNMRRFLSWRFNLKLDRKGGQDSESHETSGRKLALAFAVISHSDLDHYEGFRGLFSSPAFTFEAVYHNMLVERPAERESDKLGAREKVGGKMCVVDLIDTHDQLTELMEQIDPASKSKYVSLLRTALESNRIDRIEGLSLASGYLPGYDQNHRCQNGNRLSIEVLGPAVVEADGMRGLPWFQNPGKTKNGHSVVLKIVYGNVRVLLGGDLNVPAEEHLLDVHAGPLPYDGDLAAEEAMIERARAAFEVDLAKSCHHGSGDFSTWFLRAVNPVATVISSGDNEPHCHPRPNTLGAVGRHSRGDRPLIFSTELSRSTKEYTKPAITTQEEIRLLIAQLQEAEEADKAALQRKLDRLLDQAERNVAVYGLIVVRTDGERVVVAQKLERRRDSTGEEFDLQWLVPDANGVLSPGEP